MNIDPQTADPATWQLFNRLSQFADINVYGQNKPRTYYSPGDDGLMPNPYILMQNPQARRVAALAKGKPIRHMGNTARAVRIFGQEVAHSKGFVLANDPGMEGGPETWKASIPYIQQMFKQWKVPKNNRRQLMKLMKDQVFKYGWKGTPTNVGMPTPTPQTAPNVGGIPLIGL